MLGYRNASSQSPEIDQSDRTQIEQCSPKPAEQSSAAPFAIIDNRTFFVECIRRSLQSAFLRPVETYSSLTEFESKCPSTAISLVIMSLLEDSIQGASDAMHALSGLAANVPIVVLSDNRDLEFAKAVMGRGAKAYIPVTMGFEIALEAIRFVMAGGTYVPVDFFVTPNSPEVAPRRRWPVSDVVTARELAVVRAIRQGKPNKVIANELHMCESTVKVHVRHIMKKLSAKNRTDVAIKSADVMCSKCTTHSECWTSGCCDNLVSSSVSRTSAGLPGVHFGDRLHGDVVRVRLKTG